MNSTIISICCVIAALLFVISVALQRIAATLDCIEVHFKTSNKWLELGCRLLNDTASAVEELKNNER